MKRLLEQSRNKGRQNVRRQLLQEKLLDLVVPADRMSDGHGRAAGRKRAREAKDGRWRPVPVVERPDALNLELRLVIVGERDDVPLQQGGRARFETPRGREDAQRGRIHPKHRRIRDPVRQDGVVPQEDVANRKGVVGFERERGGAVRQGEDVRIDIRDRHQR